MRWCWLLLLQLSACGVRLVDEAVVSGGPRTAEELPRPDADRGLELLSPPFAGDWPASNGFDHDARPPGPGAGSTLSFSGDRVQGTFGHRAWDWMLPTDTPVLAPADGVVHGAGPLRPFRCDLLGRDVSDQLAVQIQHVAADGSVYETELHHLSKISVKLGDTVRAGQELGRSGNSGCSSGAHLHMMVFRVDGDRRAPVDPFGWDGAAEDPWSRASLGAPSVWLWKQAPRLFFVATRAADAADGLEPVFIAQLWYRGWRDAEHPENERLELRLDGRAGRREVDLAGWKVELPRGEALTFGPGTVLREDRPVRVLVGDGPDTATPTAIVRHAPGADRFPDDGGIVRLIDGRGRLVSLFGYGTSAAASLPAAPPLAPSCPDAAAGCVPMPRPGPVSGPVPAPGDDGAWAVAVGDPAVPALVTGGPRARVRVVGDVHAHERGERGAGTPRWLLPSLLVWDAPAADGRTTVFTAVPGLRPAEGFVEHVGDPLEVLDAAGGVVLLARRAGDLTDVWAWRVGDDAPSLVGPRAVRGPVGTVVLSPDGTHALYLRDGTLRWVTLDGGADEVLTANLPAFARYAWLGAAPVVLERGLLRRTDGRVVASELVDGWLGRDDAGEAVVVRDVRGQVSLHTAAGTVVPVTLRGTDPGEPRLRRVGDGWVLGYTARFGEGRPPALTFTSVGGAAPAGAAP